MMDDWGRPAGWFFLETALRSAHRTAVGADAVMFVIPVVGGATEDRLRAFDHVYHTFPHINASATPTHVWPIMPADGGLGKYPDVEEELMRAGSNGKLPPFIASSVFLTNHALELGYSRGPTLDNATWWEFGMGPTGVNTGSMYRGFHVPGKDVCTPAAFKQMPCVTLREMAAQPKAHMLWFAGGVYGSSPRGAESVRGRVTTLFANDSAALRFAVHAGGGLEEREGMRTSHFCLAPSGIGGGFGSRDAIALSMGCAPVYMQDRTRTPLEELLPVASYGGIQLPEADLPRLPEVLDAALARADRNRTHALRQLRCGCRALHWPWIGIDDADWEQMGDKLLEDLDREGAWASLLMLMDRRRRGAGPLVDACDAVPGSLAEELPDPLPPTLAPSPPPRSPGTGR
jgi:hypothetical protein